MCKKNSTVYGDSGKQEHLENRTWSQEAAHSNTGILHTATAMETNFPNKLIRLSSALFPWGLKREEKMICRTESLLCSWK